MTDKAFCRTCGAEISKESEICPKCGVRQKPNQVKNPGLAALASFLFPGLGQIYNGEIEKGCLFICGFFFNCFLLMLLIGFITFPLFWVYGIYDAYKSAERINA